MKHFSIHITGRVQGVFFRASAKEKADELGVQGIVRNNSDGSVAIEAEGPSESLETFVQWCKRGPSKARVDKCEIKELAPVNFRGFSVERN
jgi:acylphosphatase